MLRRTRLGISFALLLVAGQATVHAQDDTRTQARDAFAEGVSAVERGRYAEALQSFTEAYRLQPHPSVLINIGYCHLELRQPVEAARSFERYLRQTREDAQDARRDEVLRSLGRARADIGTVEVTAPPGTQVAVDNRNVGQVPLAEPLELNPGRHEVVLTTPDGAVQTEVLELASGASATVRFGSGAVVGNPFEARDLTPPQPAREVHASDDQQQDQPAEIRTAEPRVTLPPQQEPDARANGVRGFWSALPTSGWVCSGIGVVALATGIGFGATALSQQQEFDAVVSDLARTPLDDPRRAQMEADGRAIAAAQTTNATVADVLFATAAASAAIVGYLLWRDDDAEAPSAARLQISPAGFGVVVSAVVP